MATWEDGPEYAPVERPDEFAPAAAPALDVVAPGGGLGTPGLSSSGPSGVTLAPPRPRPAFDVPPVPVVALTQLAPAEPNRRDPGLPFSVVSSAVTSMDSAWGAAHWSAPGGAPVAAGPLPPPGPAPVAWPPPPDPFWPPPAPVPTGSGPAPYPAGFPLPGTPQWWGPGPPPVQQSPAVVETDTRAVVEAATPALCICLAIGGFLYPLAPLMLGVALLATSRVRVARRQVRRAFLVAGITLAVLAVIGLLLPSTYTATDWWSFLGVWSLTICWGLLVTVVVVVRRGLQRLVPPPPPPRYPPYR